MKDEEAEIKGTQDHKAVSALIVLGGPISPYSNQPPDSSVAGIRRSIQWLEMIIDTTKLKSFFRFQWAGVRSGG